MRKYLFLGFVMMLIFTACSSKKNMQQNILSNSEVASHLSSAPAVIYKTIRDFYDYVPVIMNDDRTRIVSYPDPSDLTLNGKPTKPTLLLNDYLLDNRGINKNVVFLKYTYEQYIKMTAPPSLNEMMANILEKYPLKEMYTCGLRNEYKDLVKDMNSIIANGFQNCQKADIIPLYIDLQM